MLKRNVAVLIIFIILTGIVVGYCINKTIKSTTTTVQEIEETKFKSILTSVINDLSLEDNKQYALDERYFNEDDVRTYISIMTESDAESITKEDVHQLFWDIFIPNKNNEVVYLIKKDNETLIMECVDKIKMNRLDHAFMGITNDEIIEASKGVYISQNNDKFENVAYGTSNVKNSGCGPVSLTMAINYVYGKDTVSLEEVLKWAEENNMYQANAGTKWSMITKFPKTIAVDCKEMRIGNYERFKSSLSEGEVYVTTMNKGHFTDRGHFIVITEIKGDEVSVLDPASICRSLKKWDARLVFDESKKIFWKISK